MKKTVPSGFESSARKLENGFFGRLFTRILPGASAKLKFKMAFASLWEGALPVKLFRTLLDRFLKTRVRASAVGILCFGFLSSAFSLLKIFTDGAAEHTVWALMFSLSVVIGGIALCFSRLLWHEALSGGILSGFWLMKLGGYRRDEIERKGEYQHGGRLSVAVGVLLGMLSLTVSPLYIAAVFLCTVVLLQIFYKPEFGLILIVLCFAFIPLQAVFVMSLCVLLSFLLKLFRGKRILKADHADVFVLLLFVFFALSSCFGLCDLTTVIFGAVVYLLFSKIVTTRALAQRLSDVFVFSLFAFCVLHLLAFLAKENVGYISNIILGTVPFSLERLAPSTDIVMMLLPVAAVGALKNGASKFFSFISLALGLCTLLFSQSPGAIFCFAVSLAVLILLLRKRLIPVCLGLTAVIIAVICFFPGSLWEVVQNIGGLVLGAVEKQAAIFTEFGDGGIAEILLGEFSYVDRALTLWGEFLCRYGICGIWVFVLAASFVCLKALSFIRRCPDKRLSSLELGLVLSAGILILRGFTADLIDNGFVFGFLWIICGMLSGIGDVRINNDPVQSC